jgi:hypothetical protein
VLTAKLSLLVSPVKGINLPNGFLLSKSQCMSFMNKWDYYFWKIFSFCLGPKYCWITNKPSLLFIIFNQR